ncbi:MAG: hypothetical protein AAF517_11460 [Planctomycetota bacterium]
MERESVRRGESPRRSASVSGLPFAWAAIGGRAEETSWNGVQVRWIRES